MSAGSRRHGVEHSERVHSYALQALPASELPTVEAELATCPECRQELDALRPVVASFVSWPTDVLRPPEPLWERLAQRLAAETGDEPVPPAPRRWKEPDWEEVAPGIFCKLLSTDEETGRVSMLVRLAPGVAYPSHRHAGLEELHLLDGELVIDDKTLRPGDFNRAEPGTADALVWSETGCTCVLVTSHRDELR
jgi:anti-sigma factor ChrR (cupin superfamily)